MKFLVFLLFLLMAGCWSEPKAKEKYTCLDAIKTYTKALSMRDEAKKSGNPTDALEQALESADKEMDALCDAEISR